MDTNVPVRKANQIPKWMTEQQTFQKQELKRAGLISWNTATNGKKPMPKPIADLFVSKWFSRKLLVWTATTALLLSGYIEADAWVSVALVYIGSQGAADIATKWKAANA